MQDTIALSSAEAELKATCKVMVETLGVRELANFMFKTDTDVKHHTDATACLGILKRKGAGSMKHLTVRQLWVQEVMTRPGTTTCKIARAENPADLLCSLPRSTTWQTQLRHAGYMMLKDAPSEGGE